jgi:hypothetical protein
MFSVCALGNLMRSFNSKNKIKYEHYCLLEGEKNLFKGKGMWILTSIEENLHFQQKAIRKNSDSNGHLDFL